MAAMKDFALDIERIVDSRIGDHENLSVAIGIYTAHAVLSELYGDGPMPELMHAALIMAADRAAGLEPEQLA